MYLAGRVSSHLDLFILSISAAHEMMCKRCMWMCKCRVEIVDRPLSQNWNCLLLNYSQVSLDREKMERIAAERQLAERVRELIDLQARFDAENAEANTRLKELTNANDKLRAQLSDKDHNIAMLQMSISSLETRLGAMAAREHQQLERPLSAAAPAADSDEAAY